MATENKIKEMESRIKEIMQDRDYIASNVMPRLVNANDEKFAKIKGEAFLDMKVVYCVDIGEATITLSTDAARNGLGYACMYAAAMANLNKLATSRRMRSVLADFADLSPAEDAPELLYVLSTFKPYGAAVMLDRQFIRSFANDTIGGDFYILPSSVHEVLAVPAATDLDPASLKEMVSSVNRDIVDESEVLTDSVYFYSKALDSIRIAG